MQRENAVNAENSESEQRTKRIKHNKTEMKSFQFCENSVFLS